jgi:beta-glucuronidase
MLYPIQNDKRNRLDLSGVWDFQIDPDDTGLQDQWFLGCPNPRPLAVPGSWNEQVAEIYNYTGAAWYLREVYVPQGWRGERVFIRVGSANYYTQVWFNGTLLGDHAGGHLPFAFEITDYIKWDSPNTIAIQVENHLMPTRVPAGNVAGAFDGFMAGYPSTTFDFFPYAGLHRPVVLFSLPKNHIQDVSVVTDIEGGTGKLSLNVSLNVSHNGSTATGLVSLKGKSDGFRVPFNFKSGQAEISFSVPNARFWSPEDPYLYDLTITLMDDGQITDRYTLEVGIRTVEVKGTQILLNGEPVFLKGFGRHEDFYVHGKGLNIPLIVKDYDLLKWVGANSYRTSHYPYSEEEMRMADRQGVLIIDEIPAVSLQFDDGPENINIRLEQCKNQLRDLIERDKNHPSVIMWSVANEPMPPDMVARLTGEIDTPVDPSFTDFFVELYDLARVLDPTRLVTVVGVMGGPLDWLAPSDVICINRYWGWYTQPGQPALGAELLSQELDGLFETLQKPIIVSEFGADTVAGMHSHPAKMWTEEYQEEFLRGYLDVAESKEFVVGMHVWNFADFQAVQSTNRVGGMNLKGVFTRDRKPKLAAHLLRERWNRASVLPQPQSTAKLAEGAGSTASPSRDSSIEKILSGLAAQLDGKRPGLTKTLKFDLWEAGIYRLVIENGAVRLERGDGESEAVMRVKPKDAMKIFTGKLNPMIAVTTGKIKLSGDAMAFMILQE